MSHDINQGVRRFQTAEYPRYADRFRALADGQQPPAAFITCADSRIDPALITQTEPGQLFVIRNAGNIVPPAGAADGGEAASVEFAVKGLKVSRIIVCGHSGCGAMGALLAPESAGDLPCVRRWVEHAKPALDRLGARDRHLDALIEQNVLRQLENLRSFNFIREAEQAGTLTLSGWFYRIETGEILEHDPARGAFAPLVPDAAGVWA